MSAGDETPLSQSDRSVNRFWRIAWIVLLAYTNAVGIPHAFRDCNQSNIAFFSLLPVLAVLASLAYSTISEVLKGTPHNAAEVWKDATTFWVRQYRLFPTLTVFLSILLLLTLYSEFLRFDIRRYGVYTDPDGGRTSHAVMYDRLTGQTSRFEQYCAPPDQSHD